MTNYSLNVKNLENLLLDVFNSGKKVTFHKKLSFWMSTKFLKKPP